MKEIPEPIQQENLPSKPEKILPSEPKLRNIEDTLALLRSEKIFGPDGEEIGALNWKDLYEQVGPWESGLELSDKIREVVRNYLISKFPTLKEKIPSLNKLTDEKALDALANGWDVLGKEVEKKRVEVLLSVLAHILRRIETRMYSKIIEQADEEQLQKLGLEPHIRELAINMLEASAKSDPLYIRFLAYAQLTPQPSERANPAAPIGPDGKRHTWAELFPHETQLISRKLESILANKDRWQDMEGADKFIQYIDLLRLFFSETDPKKAYKLKKEIEQAYADSITGGFPILISPPTGSYYKEPYLDPELRISLRTPESRAQEEHFISLQNAMADELETLGVGQFSEKMRKKPIASVVSIGANGANLTSIAAAETEEDITIFLDEQIRRYDKKLKDFMPLVDISEKVFPDTTPERIEMISREDTVFHELSHSVWTLDKKAQKRLGKGKSETIIAEAGAETISRGLAKELIEKGRLDYTPEQYIAGTISTLFQYFRDKDESDEYYKAAVYVANGLFEQGLVEFDGEKVLIKDIDGIFSYFKENAKKIIALYEDEEMNKKKAGRWVADNCTAGEKLQELIDFIKGKKPEEPTEQQENNNPKVELINNLDDDTFEGIYEIEKEVSTDDMALVKEDLRAAMEKPGALTVAIRNNEKILGFIVALPNSEVYEELHDDDPEFTPDPDRLYVYDLAIGKEKRSLSNFLDLVRKLKGEASARNFKGLTMHTRVGEGLSGILQKRYGAKLLRTIDDWQGYGEPFDYLELEL